MRIVDAITRKVVSTSREPIEANNKPTIPSPPPSPLDSKFRRIGEGERSDYRASRDRNSILTVGLADFHFDPEFDMKGAWPRKLWPQLPPINRFDLDHPISPDPWTRSFSKRFLLIALLSCPLTAYTYIYTCIYACRINRDAVHSAYSFAIDTLSRLPLPNINNDILPRSVTARLILNYDRPLTIFDDLNNIRLKLDDLDCRVYGEFWESVDIYANSSPGILQGRSENSFTTSGS